MNKQQMAEAIAANAYRSGPHAEADRVICISYNMERTEEQVRESYQRMLAYMATTGAEIKRHCQFSGLPGMGKGKRRPFK